MNLSKTLILTASFLSLSALGSAAVTSIPTTNGFSVTGVFADDATLSGSFTIMNGTINSASIKVSSVPGNFTEITNTGFYNQGVWEDFTMEDDGATLTLDLVLGRGQTNLNNYNGGALCTTSGNCGEIVSGYQPASRLIGNHGRGFDDQRAGDPPLTSGAVSPEPGSTLLLGAGLGALGMFFRKRFSKN